MTDEQRSHARQIRGLASEGRLFGALVVCVLGAALLASPAAAQPGPDGVKDTKKDNADKGDANKDDANKDDANKGDADKGDADKRDADKRDADKGDASPVTKPTVDPKLRVKLGTKWALPYETWQLAGDLRDKRSTLRAFFAGKAMPKLAKGSSGVLGDDDRQRIAKEALALGYYLKEIKPEHVGGRTKAVLVLEPVTYVRRVDIDVDAGNVGFVEQVLDRVFTDAVRRRMRIRPGYKLKYRRYEREQELIAERDRIEDYLREEEGYYDVVVKVRIKPAGKYAAALEVNVFLGTRYKVGDVKVVGNAAIRTAKIRSMFFHKRACIPLLLTKWCLADQRFSKRQLKRDIEAVAKMYRRRGFPAVRVYHDYSVKSYNPTKKQVDFTVYINERRRIGTRFEGNKSIPSGELQKQLTFSKEGSYDPVEVTASAAAIQKYYQSKGYFEATVTTERVPFKGEAFESIVFTIDEGPKLAVRSIEFDGNQSLTDAQVKKVVRTTPYSARTPFSRKLYPTTAQLQADVRRIEKLYRSEGFPEARVTLMVTRADKLGDSVAVLAAVVASQRPTKGLVVKFEIAEGPRHAIGALKIEFVGEHRLSEAKLRSQLKLRAGQPFLQRKIEAAVERLKSYYFGHGYPDAKIVARIDKGKNPTRPTVVLRVDETQMKRFGKLLIRGNFRTKAWVIRDELDYAGRLTDKKLDRGRQNLLRANLFNGATVELHQRKDSTDPNVNVLVTVQERNDRTLDAQLGAGYSTDSKEFVEAGLIAPNIKGWGVRADLKGFYGREFKSGELKITFPRWIARRVVKTPVELAVAAFARNELTQRFGDLVSFGSSAEFTWTSDRQAFRGWRLSLRYDFRQRNREEQLVRGSGPRDGIETDVVKTRTAAIGPRLAIERRTDRHGRENVMDPEQGYRFEVRALYASPRIGGDDEFIKVGVSGQYFTGLGTDRFTLMNGVRYDQGFPLGNAVLLPEVERYFAGGDTTIRGFEEDRLATEIIKDNVPPFNDLTSIRILPAGGNLRFLYNIDLQVKLFKLGPLPVASGVFIDTGLVANSLDAFKLRDLRHSIGTALRLSSPFFRFSLEWAVPLDPQLGDNPLGRFHITIGALF